MKVVIIILKIESGLEANPKDVEKKFYWLISSKCCTVKKEAERVRERAFRRNEGEPKRSELKIQN